MRERRLEFAQKQPKSSDRKTKPNQGDRGSQPCEKGALIGLVLTLAVNLLHGVAI